MNRIAKLSTNANTIRSIIEFKQDPFVKQKVDNISEKTVNKWTKCKWREYAQKYMERNRGIVKWRWIYIIL